MNFEQIPMMGKPRAAAPVKKAKPQLDAIYYDTNLGQIMNYNEATGARTPVTMEKDGIELTKATTPANQTVIGGGAPAKVLDQAQINSLLSRLASTDVDLKNAITQATLSRDADRKKKEEELERETGKFDTKMLGNTQDFGENINDSELMTRETLNNLVSSMSVLGLGGSQELTRQILDASARSGREANATQARNAQDLTSAFNDFSAGNKNDLLKIDDQFNYAKGEAQKAQAKERQNLLQKMADTYQDGGRTADRERVMREADSLNSVISNSAFLNPQYTGETKVMATPELGQFTQETPQYQLGVGGGVTPAGAGSASSTALGMKTAPVNEQDFGVKKKTEGGLGYGV